MFDDVMWSGIVSMGVLYLLVWAVGIGSTRGTRTSDALDELMLAGRDLPLWVGLLTMTATWVGGGYINGTAEQAFSAGPLWGAQAGIGYALSLIFGGVFYARVMRRCGFATLVDPLERRYGKRTAALLMVPAVAAELFWCAAILVALGSTFGTVVGLPLVPAILLSAVVAVAYTVGGGLRAVAYTDVIQLFLIVGGLGLAMPVVIRAAGGVSTISAALSGASFADVTEASSYGDYFVLLIFGGIPWNVYFQRVLSSPGPEQAARMSIAAGLLCALMAVPPLLLGLAATSVDWSAVAGPEAAAALADQPAMVLPWLLRYAVPNWVGVLGLGAIAAAVMSSVDSSILSAASMVAWNGYRRLINPNASADQVARLVKILVVIFGSLATLVALGAGGSVSALWYLCGDIVYCVLFPQLTLALFDRRANRSGALAGLLVSVVLRAMLSIVQFRTAAMLGGLAVSLLVSRLTQASDPPRPLGDPELDEDTGVALP